jgi:hypothetical protein
MTRRNVLAAFVVVAFAFAGVARAADEKKSPIDGTWKWSVQGQNNQSFEQTMVLKMEGDKVTGKILGRNNNETPIADATFKDGTLAFTVTRERNGNKVVSKYSGKVEGDTIKGKIESERNGQNNSRDWEAKREKAEKPAA